MTCPFASGVQWSALAAALLVQPVVPAISEDAQGEVFRTAARAFTTCLEEQSRISMMQGESPLAYADRVYTDCAAEMDAFAEAAREGWSPRPQRIKGAIRAAISDAVLDYERRAAFRD